MNLMIEKKQNRNFLKHATIILAVLLWSPLQGATTQQTTTPRTLTVEERFAQLMDDAKQAMEQKNYSRAIAIYTKLSDSKDSPHHQQALEFLGLARERKGQQAHAKAIYERYLKEYPKSDGANRVSQRLAGLITARDIPKKKLRKRAEKKEVAHWDMYGSFSQFYRHRVDIDENQEKELRQSMLSTYFNITGRSRGFDNYELKSRFTASYKNDFLKGREGDSGRINTLYFDARNKRSNFSTRIGRQRLNSGGVLGRFDGLFAGYKINDWTQLNFVAGLPVEYSSMETINTDKRFYGINADFGTFADSWDINSYFIDQTVNGISDRRAIGGEVRYFTQEASLFSLLDYDILYNEVNTLLFSGNWTLANKNVINVALDHRKSPTLSTENALQGQSEQSITELLQRLSEKEIQALAKDRTAESRTYSLGLSRPLNEKLQINGDISFSTFSSTPASGGIEAYEGSKSSDYSLQLVGNSFIKNGDMAIVGLRYSDSDYSNTTTLNINTRYPVNQSWRVNPKFKVSLRKNNRSQSDRWTTAPSLRLDYRLYKNVRFEFEGGWEWIKENLQNDTIKDSSYFLNIGYRIDF